MINLIILDRTKAGKYLSGSNSHKITHLISITDTYAGSFGSDIRTKPAFNFYGHPAKKIHLKFDDINMDDHDNYTGPTKDDIRKIIKFGDEIKESGSATLLIHCWAGISRSTAAGLIILDRIYKFEKTHHEISQMIFSLRPNAKPNSRMIKMYDEMENISSDRTCSTYTEEFGYENL